MNLTNFQKKLIWGVGILSLICLWIAFPLIFKALIESYKFPANFNSFGPFGDIYGSLNTLISSIALCAVAYSTYLQVTSLKESREVNARQISLAQQTHNEQIIESQNAIFATKFYSLLNFKKDKLNSLTVQKKVPFGENEFRYTQEEGVRAMDEISWKFCQRLKENITLYNGFTREKLFNDFKQVTKELNYQALSSMISYFHIYKDLCRLIRYSNISEEDKTFYKSVLSNSMTQGEQLLLFWIKPMFGGIDIADSEIFTLFIHSEIFENFGLQFHKEHHFKSKKWKNAFRKSKNLA